MAYPVVIEDAESRAKLTLAGTVSRGDLLAYSSGWVRADASDADPNLYAQYMALNAGISGDVIKGCKSCVIYDEDGLHTANATLYCSGTAGEITTTRPATAADVIQVVGRSVDAKRSKIDLEAPRELEVWLPPSAYDTTQEPGLGIIDSPVWVGPGLDATGEDVYFTSRFPSGVLSVAIARVVYNSVGETTGTISGSIIVAADGATNTGNTGAAFTLAAPTSLADETLCYSDMAAMFNAAALKAGYNFTVAITEGGSQTDNLQVLGLYMRYIVV